MHPLTPILFPVDFSNRSAEMIPYVQLLASKYFSQIILLHVVNPILIVPETGVSAPGAVPVPAWFIKQQADRLDAFGKQEFDGLPVRRLVYEGQAETQIVAAAEAERAGLIVMPTHGYGRFRRFLIGSVTAKVLDDIDTLVLTGTHLQECRASHDLRIETVVCAVDLGPLCCDVLSAAAELASDFGARLKVIHAVRPSLDSLSSDFQVEVKQDAERSIWNELAQLRNSMPLGEISVHPQNGETTQVVCQFAQEARADLLVIGRGLRAPHGRLRAHAYSIVQHSPCPVLSV